MQNIQVIDNFISELHFDQIQQLQAASSEQLQQAGIAKYTSEMTEAPDSYRLLEKNINKQINAKVTTLENGKRQAKLTLSILRINTAKYRSTLHHDKNSNSKRRLTVILYCNRPEQGGQLVFPYYNSDRQRCYNALTNHLDDLADSNQYFADSNEFDLIDALPWTQQPIERLSSITKT